MTTSDTPIHADLGASGHPRRRRHRLRWILIGAVTLLLLLAATAVVAIRLQPSPEPLALPAEPAAPTGVLDGRWQAAPGSVAGFRVKQTVLGMSSDAVGRTSDISGTAEIRPGWLDDARFRINLLALTSNDRPAPQFAASLETNTYPEATVTLTRPLGIDPAFTGGATIATTAHAQLTLHGTSRTVAVSLSARRDASAVVVVGSIPVAFADWGIVQPKGYGSLGSLADHGTAEFLIRLRRA